MIKILLGILFLFVFLTFTNSLVYAERKCSRTVTCSDGVEIIDKKCHVSYTKTIINGHRVDNHSDDDSDGHGTHRHHDDFDDPNGGRHHGDDDEDPCHIAHHGHRVDSNIDDPYGLRQLPPKDDNNDDPYGLRKKLHHKVVSDDPDASKQGSNQVLNEEL
ncbi:MAG: hypothetical protein WCH62_09025, partial [Candidatus Omnitrophota bacterium]